MDAFATLLTITSTFFHAGWNLLARKERNEHTFILRALVVVAVFGLAPALIAHLLLAPLPKAVWVCALASGLCSGIYFFALARAYTSGDFTFVYPIARAVPVLLVGMGDVLQGRFPTQIGWLGMSLVALGVLVIPIHSFKELHVRMYFNRTTVWVIVAALGTTGYSLVDKYASDVIAKTGGGILPALRYCYLFYALGTGVCYIMVSLFGTNNEDKSAVGWKKPAIAGFLTFGAYSLVLWAFQMATHAGYLVAFRQFSILIGVAIAVLCFRERGAFIRLAASCIIVLGLVLIMLFG